MKKTLLVISGFIAFFSGYSQIVVTGKVISEKTREPLPFVNIGIQGTNRGTTSDIDGRFSISINEQNVRLNFTYVG